MKSEVLEKFIEYNKQLRISKKGNCENKIKLDNLNEIQLKYKEYKDFICEFKVEDINEALTYYYMGFNNCVDEQFDNIYKNNFKEMNEGTLIYFNGKISNNKFVDYVVLGIMISGHYDSYKELFNKLNVNGDICINSLKEEYEFKKEYSKKEDDEE